MQIHELLRNAHGQSLSPEVNGTDLANVLLKLWFFKDISESYVLSVLHGE